MLAPAATPAGETMTPQQHETITPQQQQARDFYLRAMQVLDEAGVEFLVGGGFAMKHHTGIVRDTKDLDVFVYPGASRKAVDALAAADFKTEWPWPHFLARATSDTGAFIDILYNSGNGLAPVDEEWFNHAEEGDLLDRRVRLVPAEEIVVSKSFVMERDRFDGADVAHLMLRKGRRFDWARLLRRFAGHERVLLAQLLMFGYVYPCERDIIPAKVLDELQQSIRDEPKVTDKICRGTFLAQHQYQIDVHQWGYTDARLQPLGPLRADDLARFAPPDAPPIR
jgi:hypothetical protein